MKHFSKMQFMNERGMEIDCPLRKAFTPFRLLPQKWQPLKRARVHPNRQTPSFWASKNEQFDATK
jgi:hypothetical protein